MATEQGTDAEWHTFVQTFTAQWEADRMSRRQMYLMFDECAKRLHREGRTRADVQLDAARMKALLLYFWATKQLPFLADVLAQIATVPVPLPDALHVHATNLAAKLKALVAPCATLHDLVRNSQVYMRTDTVVVVGRAVVRGQDGCPRALVYARSLDNVRSQLHFDVCFLHDNDADPRPWGWRTARRAL